jgi:hypothetical protein
LRILPGLVPNSLRLQGCQETGSTNGNNVCFRVPLDDEQVLSGLSRAPHHPPPRLDPEVRDRLLEIRDDPPEGLGRTPGPKTILSYLKREETLKEMKLRLPKSTRTRHRLLRENGRIALRLPKVSDPLERPAPMQQGPLDFKDARHAVPRIRTARNHMGGKRSTVSTKVPHYWWLIMCAPILQLRRL